MCGIVSIIGISGEQPDGAAIDKMSSSIRHRGPDGQGRYIDGRVGFGFRRLSILDLSSHGHQPMSSEDGNIVIVFNGEIFNYIEIRKELLQLGYTFRSTGDTEVLLNAYRQWGEECVNRLNGMWAFLIYDRKSGTIFGSRDRFGIKPLYLFRTVDWILFASEIKAFAASGLYNPSPNWNLASQYLLEGRLSQPDESKETLYKDIIEVPAGSAFCLGLNGKLREWSYWKIADDRHIPKNDSAERFAQLFQDSVRLRMRSDVPVGVCLSGGLDSTAIICEMARELRTGNDQIDGGLQAFSYTAPEFDEMPQIEATIEQTGARLHRLSLNANTFWDRLSEVAHFQDEPVHSMNVVVSYELYRMSTLNGVKVILNGQGADETLGGYPSYFAQYWYSLLQSGKLRECWKEIGDYCYVHGKNRERMFASELRYFIQTQFSRALLYRRLAHRRRRLNLNDNNWFTKELVERSDPDVRSFENQALESVLRSSVRKQPLPLYLRVEDRNSMANSVEARLPFLDYRLVNFVFGLADNLKIRGPWNKYVLRESMRGRIPDIVRKRVDKMGFPVPQSNWFAYSLNAHLMDFLSSRKVKERGIYQSNSILRDVSAFRDGKIDISNDIFRIVQFELFCRLIESE